MTRSTSSDTLLSPRDPRFHSKSISVDELVLVVTEGPHQETRLPLRKEQVLIGRGTWCELCLEDDLHISKQHAELFVREDGVVLVRDLGSRNGVYIDGVRILEAYLERGDTLQIGESSMVLQVGERKQKMELRFFDKSQQLVGQGPQMRKLFAQLERIGPMDFPILLSGETGVGKTCIARALHHHSQRSGAFVVVNCGAISASLMESLFFGYEKGAFTGADQDHRGYFEQAHGGTLFLDEIAELPLELQPRFLDVLERQKVRRLGSEQEREVQLRIVAATHRTLADEVKQGNFREDLYYRLAVVELMVPPLRERTEDLSLLLQWQLQEMGLHEKISLTPAALRKFKHYPWPGNVRELRNVLNRSLAFCDLDAEGQTTLDADDVLLPTMAPASDAAHSPQTFREAPGLVASGPRWAPGQAVGSLKEFLAQTEKQVLLDALESHEWNISATARSLEITRAWLYKRIKHFELRQES